MAQVVAGQVGKHAQLEIRQRTYRECNAVFGQALHQKRVLARLHAVVNTLDLEQIERSPDISRRAFLAGVRDQMKLQLAAARKHFGKLFGRVADFTGIESDADEFASKRQGLFQRFKSILFTEVSQKTHDEAGAHAVFSLRVHTGAVQAVDDNLHAHAACGVGLRIKKQLGVQYLVCRSFCKVGHGHVVKVLLFEQHTGAGVINVQKALQVGKCIGAAQLFNAAVGNSHAVAFCERKNQLGLQRTFNVDVKLGLGHAAQQIGQAVSRDGFDDKTHGDNSKMRKAA